MDSSISGVSGAPAGDANAPHEYPALQKSIEPESRVARGAWLSALPHFRGTSKGALARRAELGKPVRFHLYPTSGDRLPLPAAYASRISLSRAPLESTGRPTTDDAHWATGFAARAPACAGLFKREVEYQGPGFQHDPQHFAGVGRGVGANLWAFCRARGKRFPGRLGTVGLDFYEAVGYRHDWNFGSDRKPPSVPNTLRDYDKQAARNAHFDSFELLAAKIKTAATAHHVSERAQAKWYKMLGDAVEEGEVSREEATAMVMQCQMYAVVDQSEILCTARSFHESYARLSLLMAEWGERDDEPLAKIEPAKSASMCKSDFYDDVGSPDWHERFFAEGIAYLSDRELIDKKTLEKEFKLPDVQTIRDRIPTEGPGFRAIYAGSVAVFDAFEADQTLTHEQLIEIGTRAVDANLIQRGTERLAQISAEKPHHAAGLALLLDAMKRFDGDPLSKTRLQMQVSMATMLGDEAVMPVSYEAWMAAEAVSAGA